jgi:pyruvate/2-oxoglutarate dehydrogenase complex dihydrolipoamide dehydrogenase (E3) component
LNLAEEKANAACIVNWRSYKMRVSDYDLVVVGSGPAGQTVGRQANGDQLHMEATGLATSMYNDQQNYFRALLKVLKS